MYSPGGNKPNGSGKHHATLFKNLGFYKKRYRLSLLNKGTENMIKINRNVAAAMTVEEVEEFIKQYLEVYDTEVYFQHKDGNIFMEKKRNHTLH